MTAAPAKFKYSGHERGRRGRAIDPRSPGKPQRNRTPDGRVVREAIHTADDLFFMATRARRFEYLPDGLAFSVSGNPIFNGRIKTTRMPNSLYMIEFMLVQRASTPFGECEYEVVHRVWDIQLNELLEEINPILEGDEADYDEARDRYIGRSYLLFIACSSNQCPGVP